MSAKTWTQADREAAADDARRHLADLESMGDHFIVDKYASVDEHAAETSAAFDLFWTLTYSGSTADEVAAAIAAINARWA
jgi:hypothetical protein